MRDNPNKLNDLGVPLFFGNIHIHSCFQSFFLGRNSFHQVIFRPAWPNLIHRKNGGHPSPTTTHFKGAQIYPSPNRSPSHRRSQRQKVIKINLFALLSTQKRGWTLCWNIMWTHVNPIWWNLRELHRKKRCLISYKQSPMDPIFPHFLRMVSWKLSTLRIFWGDCTPLHHFWQYAWMHKWSYISCKQGYNPSYPFKRLFVGAQLVGKGYHVSSCLLFDKDGLWHMTISGVSIN